MSLGMIIFSQNSFELLIQMPNYEVPGDMIIDNQGDYIIVGSSLNFDTDVSSGLLIKVSASGDVLSELIYSVPDSTCLFNNIVQLDSGYLVFGGIGTISSGMTSILICSFDFDLNFQWQKEYLISDIHIIGDFEVKVDLDSNLVIIGSAYKEVKYLDDDPFEFKCNQSGDSILMHIETLDYHQLVFDFLIKQDSSGYIVFGSGQYPNYPYLDANGAYYDRAFIREQVKEVPNEIYWSHTVMWIDDKEFFISGNKNLHTYPTIQGVGLMRVDTSFNSIYDIHFGLFQDTACYPGWDRSFDFKNIDNVFFTGTKNYEHWFQNMSSWIMLSKFDSCLNTKYERIYGGDALYSSYQINATEDGGCIISGIRYDYRNQDYNYDIYLIKTDSNGLTTSIEEDYSHNMSSIQPYPNPCTERISFDHNLTRVDIYNHSGQLVLRNQNYNQFSDIAVGQLQSGIYIYRVLNKEGGFASGKFVKR
jgi:hypothetical protein